MLNKELVASGIVPVFSANVTEPFGYLNQTLFDDFSIPSVLWGIDGDWMVSYVEAEKPFYPTDHCGVLRVMSDSVNPRYLAHALEVAGQQAKFSRSYRASTDRIAGLTIQVPNISAQNQIIEQVKELETKINQALKHLNQIANQRSKIISDFLT